MRRARRRSVVKTCQIQVLTAVLLYNSPESDELQISPYNITSIDLSSRQIVDSASFREKENLELE